MPGFFYYLIFFLALLNILEHLELNNKKLSASLDNKKEDYIQIYATFNASIHSVSILTLHHSNMYFVEWILETTHFIASLKRILACFCFLATSACECVREPEVTNGHEVECWKISVLVLEIADRSFSSQYDHQSFVVWFYNFFFLLQ